MRREAKANLQQALDVVGATQDRIQACLRMAMSYAKLSADFVAEFVNNVRRKP